MTPSQITSIDEMQMRPIKTSNVYYKLTVLAVNSRKIDPGCSKLTESTKVNFSEFDRPNSYFACKRPLEYIMHT